MTGRTVLSVTKRKPESLFCFFFNCRKHPPKPLSRPETQVLPCKNSPKVRSVRRWRAQEQTFLRNIFRRDAHPGNTRCASPKNQLPKKSRFPALPTSKRGRKNRIFIRFIFLVGPKNKRTIRHKVLIGKFITRTFLLRRPLTEGWRRQRPSDGRKNEFSNHRFTTKRKHGGLFRHTPRIGQRCNLTIRSIRTTFLPATTSVTAASTNTMPSSMRGVSRSPNTSTPKNRAVMGSSAPRIAA